MICGQPAGAYRNCGGICRWQSYRHPLFQIEVIAGPLSPLSAVIFPLQCICKGESEIPLIPDEHLLDGVI
jgi:hypothetical protein